MTVPPEYSGEDVSALSAAAIARASLRLDSALPVPLVVRLSPLAPHGSCFLSLAGDDALGAARWRSKAFRRPMVRPPLPASWLQDKTRPLPELRDPFHLHLSNLEWTRLGEHSNPSQHPLLRLRLLFPLGALPCLAKLTGHLSNLPPPFCLIPLVPTSLDLCTV